MIKYSWQTNRIMCRDDGVFTFARREFQVTVFELRLVELNEPTISLSQHDCGSCQNIAL